jgi:hypothetical protein
MEAEGPEVATISEQATPNAEPVPFTITKITTT